MKLGVLTNAMSDKSLDEALQFMSDRGVQMAEIGCGGYPGKAHCDPEVLLRDDKKLQEFKDTFKKHNIEISALSAHGNMVHPNKETAAQFDADFRNAILLAEKLDLHIVNTFSGCPGDHEGAKYPNWTTCPWPTDFTEVMNYQWNDVLIPYWEKTSKFAKEHGVDKIALELHPGFCVYNTDSMLKLRAAVGDVMGANLDPSHLFWQGMDPVAVIRKLGPAIFHFHAKDTFVDKYNTAVNGVLDMKGYTDEINRSWIFRSVGYGHDYLTWKDIISNLRMVGYDYAISIEHEDSLMTRDEGLSKAIKFLQEVLVFEGKTEAWWAN